MLKVICLEMGALPLFTNSPVDYGTKLEEVLNSSEGELVTVIQKSVGRTTYNYAVYREATETPETPESEEAPVPSSSRKAKK